MVQSVLRVIRVWPPGNRAHTIATATTISYLEDVADRPVSCAMRVVLHGWGDSVWAKSQ